VSVKALHRLIPGSITTLTTNPIWTVQTAQATRAVVSGTAADGKVKKIKPSAIQAAKAIYKQDGIPGFWRGIGPALILVMNPVIQYTTYERLVGMLLAYRTAKGGLTPTGKSGVLGRSSLSDWDLFFLGAASKLVATGGTYPYVSFIVLVFRI